MMEKQDLVNGLSQFFDAADAAQKRLTERDQIVARETIRAEIVAASGKDEGLVPPEVLLRGDYSDATVVAEDRSQATVKRNRTTNPIAEMYERGTITPEQFEASIEIAWVAEIIGSAVGVRSSSMEARVDNSGAAKDMLIESLGRVRLEATYSAWRQYTPVPKRMVIDLVLGSITLNAAARRYRMRKVKARKMLTDALDRWLQLRDKKAKEIDEQDVQSAHFRAGGGTLT